VSFKDFKVGDWFLPVKAGLSFVLAWYLPSFIPFIIMYWLSVAFIWWRGPRGVIAHAPKTAATYLGGYPGLIPPRNIWLAIEKDSLVSGGMRLPLAEIRRVRLLDARDAAREGFVAEAKAEDVLAVLWRRPGGEESEVVFGSVQGGVQGRKVLEALRAGIEGARKDEAARRRAA